VNRTGIFLLLLVALGGPLSAQQAQEERLRVSQQVDWQAGVLILEVALAIEARDFNPSSRFDAEREIERLLPGLFMSSVVEIPFDSYRTIGDRLKEDQLLFQHLESTAVSSVTKSFSRVRKDLREIQVQYRFPFYGEGGFVAPFILHSRPYPVERKLGFVPSRNFTGLVIYAGGELPAHGKDIRQRVQPALFPTLYDEEMNPVLSVQMCEPSYLKRWGMVAYSESETDSALLERIGAAPLRTVARGVFGINATDLLLPSEAVDRLLVREANRKLLSQGRVLIVIASGEQPEEQPGEQPGEQSSED
jgi:hypothetical protein